MLQLDSIHFTTCILALVGACTVADADPQPAGSTGGSTDGLGQSNTSASDPTAPGDTNAPTNPGTDDDPPDTTSTAGLDGGDDTSLSTTTAAPDGPPLDMPCGGGTVEQYQEGDWSQALASYDPGLFPQLTCQTPPSPSNLPIPGLAQALVIRNDALPLPREFVTPSARWLLWSNVELGCADPFAAPLCAGQWRVSVPLYMPVWCELRIAETGLGDYAINFDQDYPFLIEVGDADCAVQTFRIGPNEAFTTLQFQGMGDKLPGDPQPGELRAECAVPGIDTPLLGTFSAEICPG